MEDAVVLDRRRNHQHVCRAHVESKMGDAVFRRQQHPDDQLLVAGGALRADAQVERADTEGEITDADMRQPAAQAAAPELHDVDMRTLHGLMQSLEAV